MASSNGYQRIQNEEDSNASNSNSESSTEPKDARGFNLSSPPVLEPSKDESRRSGDVARSKISQEKFISHSWPLPSNKEISVCSSGESAELEDEHQNSGYQRSTQQQVETSETESRRPFCYTVVDKYNQCIEKFKDSWMIHFVQVLILLEAVSAIVMGSMFYRGCDGARPQTGPTLTILIGIASLIFVYMWFSKTIREHNGERYWNFQKDRMLLCFVILLFFMGLELMFFSQESPKLSLNVTNEPSPDLVLRCDPTYYYYMYYLHFVNAGFVSFGALLYLLDCGRYLKNRQDIRTPHINGHYEPL